MVKGHCLTRPQGGIEESRKEDQMGSWKVVKFGNGFAVQTPDPSPEETGTYNVPGQLICRQDKAGIYGSELSEEEAHIISAVLEMYDALKQVKPMAKTLIDEHGTGKGPATNWGIVNDCLCTVAKAIAKAEGRKS